MASEYKNVYLEYAEEGEYVNKQLALDLVQFCLQCKPHGQRYAIQIPRIEALKAFKEDIKELYKKEQFYDIKINGLPTTFKDYMVLILEHGLEGAVNITHQKEELQSREQRIRTARERDLHLEKFTRGSVMDKSGRTYFSEEGTPSDRNWLDNLVRQEEDNR